MARYRARAILSIATTAGIQSIPVGGEFESDAVPGAAWHPLDDAARAASRLRFGSDAPTEFTRHTWDASQGMTPEGQEADPRVRGSFTADDGVTRY